MGKCTRKQVVYLWFFSYFKRINFNIPDHLSIKKNTFPIQIKDISDTRYARKSWIRFEPSG